MKTKEILQLCVAAVVIAISGYIIFAQISPKSKTGAKTQPTIEKVTPIATDYDSKSLDRLADNSKVRDFYNPPDLKNGLGNSQPFGPLR